MTVPTAEDLRPTMMEREEFKRSRYFHSVPDGVTVEDLLDPNYWVNVASQLRRHDFIGALGPHFDIELRVVGLDERMLDPRVHIVLQHIGWCELPIKQPAAEPIEYEVSHTEEGHWSATSAEGRNLLRGYDSQEAVHAAMAAINRSLWFPTIPKEILAKYAPRPAAAAQKRGRS